MIMSSKFANVPLPDTYEELTVYQPVLFVTDEIVNKANTLASNFFDIRKWPLIVEVEVPIVLRKDEISVDASFDESI